MNELLRKLNHRYLFISWVLGTFCSCGLMLSLTKEATKANSDGINMNNEFMVNIRTIYLSFSGDRLKTLLLMAVIGVLVYLGLKIRNSTKERVMLAAYSVVFAFAQMIAQSYKTVGSWDLLFETEVNRVRALMRGTAYAVVCYYLLKIIFYVIQHYLTQQSASVITMQGKKRFFQVAAVLFICWLPYFVIFYPGTSNEDTVIQMLEYFQIHSYINEMTAVQGADIFFTNHHPYLLTLLFGGFIQLGLLLGDIRLGVALYSLLHMLFLAGTFSAALLYLSYVGVSAKRVRAVRYLLMFLPIFPLYSICMVKDTIYAALCLLFILMMYEVMRTKGEALGKVSFGVMLFVTGLLMMLTKVYGMYILVIVSVWYLLRYRRYWKRILLSLAVPVFLYQCIFIKILFPALNVAPGGVQEGLSVPIQQTARYVTEYGDEVTAEERAAIDEVLVYEDLPEDYNPELSDPVKKKFRQDSTKEEQREYFKVWFEMFLKHPEVYVEATLNNTYQYYDINKISSLEYYEFNRYLQENKDEVDEDCSWLYVEHPKCFDEARYAVNQLVLLLQKIPGVNLLMSMGLLPWILLGMVYLYIFRGESGCLETLLVQILTVAICLLSPDNGNYRYIMPIIFSLPFTGMLVLVKAEKEKNRRGRKCAESRKTAIK